MLQFCLAGDGWGRASTEGDVAVLKIIVSRPELATQAYRYEGETFEATLQQAIDGGILKASSVEKQIAFLTNTSGTSTRQPTAELIDAALFASLTAGISAVVHETQRERGISALYTASAGRIFAAELLEQWQRTDQRSRDLLALRHKHQDRLPVAIARQLEEADRLLELVLSARPRVKSLGTLPADLISIYSQLNGEILRTIDDLSSRISDPLQRPSALAWMSLLHAKEKAGIERAQLASAFARDRYVEGQYVAVSALIAGRQCYLHLFGAAAPKPTARDLHERLGRDVMRDVELMERVALDKRDGGFGVDARRWFEVSTRLVEAMGQIESSLRVSFLRP